MPERSPQPESPAVRLPSIQSSVYVPLVHGVGAASHEEWTGKSLHRLVEWWTNTQRPVCATLIPECPPKCALTEHHHKHLLLVGDGRAARVDIETLYWADRVKRPSKRECASLALKAGSLLGLVDLAAAAAARSDQIPDPARLTIRYAADTSQFAFSWLRLGVRALVTPLLALVVAAACCTGRVHRALGDALAWGQSAADRRKVKLHVRDGLAKRRGASRLMIGHSMGGAVLAEIFRDQKPIPKHDRLLTLGSGTAMLSALDVLAPEWSVRRVALAWLAVYLGLAGSCYMIGTFLLGNIGLLLYELAKITLVAAPTDAAAYFDALKLRLMAFPTAPLPFAFIAVLVALVVVAQVVGERDRLLRRTVRTRAKGIDALASHDSVSAALVELGEPQRVVGIAQTGSIPLDHNSYFRNGCVVLPLIAAEVERMAGLRSPEQDDEDGLIAAHHRWGLSFGKRTCLTAGLALAATAYTLTRDQLPTAPPLLLALVLAAAGAAAAAWWGFEWLKRISEDAGSTPGVVCERQRAQAGRLDRRYTSAVAVVAVLLFGPLTGAHHVAGLLFGVGLGITAWLSWFGARGAEALTLASAAAAAAVWFSTPDAGGIAVGALCAAVSAWSAARLHRRAQRRGALRPSEQ